MNTAHTLYRSTLVAAAIATASLGAASAAEAHEQGWREGPARAWQPAPPPRWYRHGDRNARGYGYGGWRYGPAVRECAVPSAASAYFAPPGPYAPRVELGLPLRW